LAAVATASGVDPQIAGKPFTPMGDLVRQTLGVKDLAKCWMVGDRFSTGGMFAKNIGAKFCLVTSGVKTQEQAIALQQQHKFALVERREQSRSRLRPVGYSDDWPAQESTEPCREYCSARSCNNLSHEVKKVSTCCRQQALHSLRTATNLKFSKE